MNFKIVFSLLMSLFCVLTSFGQTYRVITIGDSTVQDYNDGWVPRKGWGQMLPFFFTSGVKVENKAIGGTSSKSFYDRHWSDIRASLKANDFVFIQFGINDRSKEEYRYAPQGVFEDYIKKFIADITAKGAIPVLVTTVRRNAWKDGNIYDSYHEHPQLMRNVAKEKNVPCVDLDKYCYDMFLQQKQTYVSRHVTMNLVAGEYPNFKSGNADDVHYQETGSTYNARAVVHFIKNSTDKNLKKLAPFIKPMHKVTFKINDESKASTVSMSGYFPEGINVTLKTIPNNNAKFLRWEDGNKKTISTNSLHVLKMGNKDVVYKAVYQSNTDKDVVIKDDGIKFDNAASGSSVDVNGEIEIDNQKKELIAPSASKYKWYFNNAAITGATAKNLAVTNNGTYSVELFDNNGKLVARKDICVTIGKDGTVRKIYLIGDSTVCDYKDNKFPMTGWGQLLGLFFNSNIQIDNHAIGGRSSRSFREQGRWKTIQNALKPGDFVFIQFGHNDRDYSKAERYTSVADYKLYIDSFVVEAREKGAIPVLVSPMVMNAWRNDAMRNVFTESGNDYRGAMAEIAKKHNAPFVDLNMLSYNLFKTLNSSYLSSFFYNTYPAGEYPNYPTGSNDGTHFQEMGALTLCRLITEELNKIDDPYICALTKYLKPLYTATFNANVANAGNITLTAKFPEGANVSAKILPASGKKFLKWNQDGADKDAKTIYRFKMPAKNTVLTAMFEGGSAVPPADKPVVFPEGKKRVAYITDFAGADYGNDIKILPALKACDDLFIHEVDASKEGFDVSPYDLVVISEVTPSTAPVMASLKNISKPTLTMKVHAYKNATAAWSWAANGFGDNTTATTITVADDKKSHPIFKGVEFANGNEVQMVSEVNVKALTFMNPESFTEVTGTVSSLAEIKGEEKQNTILEAKAGTVIAGSTLQADLVQIGLNSSSYANVTDNGVAIVRNACYYLLGMLKAEETFVQYELSNVISIYPNPVKDFLYIRSLEQNASFARIVSIAGVEVLQTPLTFINGVAEVYVGNSGLSGVYVLILEKDGKAVLSKQIVIK